VGVTLLADRFGGNPHRGCGFVQFGSAERLRDALALSGRITLGGRQIFLERRRSEP
jgi:hypothetical protein